MRWCAISLFVCCLAALAQTPKSFSVGDGGRLFRGVDVDALLERPYRDDVPMACSGDALWAAHPSGWAFPKSSVHWYLLSNKGIGFDLQLIANQQPVVPASGVMRPSHVKLTADQPVRVEGVKWITQDDVLVSHLSIENTSAVAVDLLATVILPSAAVTEQEELRAWTVEHAGLTVSARAHLPGFEVDETAVASRAVYVVEGEKPDTRVGGKEIDRKPAASGGQVLGSNFGAQAGDQAGYLVNVAEKIEDATLTIRYARGSEGGAQAAVHLPGRNRMEARTFPATGGWGENAAEFGTQKFRIGALEAGVARISFLLTTGGSNINIDALYVHDSKTDPFALQGEQTRFSRSIRIEPNAKESILLTAAFARTAESASEAVKRVAALSDPLADQTEQYAKWIVDNVPHFVSLDQGLTKQYWHRATSVTRKTLFKVGDGRLTDWGIAEGRWGSSWYSNLISYGAGHQIRETRWLRDPQYVHGIISTWCNNLKPNGIFPNYIRTNEIGDGQYTDWITSTVWDAACVHPDVEKLRGWSDALRQNVDGWLAVYDTDNDGLLLVDSHWWTGMEWQPSFFFFNGFDKDKQEQHLERVDLTAYVYGNAKNLSKIYALVGDAHGETKYREIAEKIRAAMETAMWDETTKFFYSLEPASGNKALVKEVVGVYPFYFSMFEGDSAARYLSAWNSILDPAEFWTAWPVASATKKSPAYSQDVNFNGKRVGGCMWNGPTWPHANSIVLSAMAATLRENASSPLTKDKLFELFQSFTMAQFKDQDLAFPWTGEYYNGDTAAWRTDERDYNHSTYLDILIADIAGLRPRADNVIELHPLIGTQVPPFLIDGIRYHDHDVSILWSPAGNVENQPDGLQGYRVYVDGKLAHHNPDGAARVEIPG